MKKTAFIIILFAAIGFSFAFDKKPVNPGKSIRTLIIDPGHGGLDPGAPGRFSTEANVALAVSLKLGDAIQKEFSDIKIIYIRN